MRVFKIRTLNGGRAGCGHRVGKNKVSFLVDGVKVAYTFCEKCGKDKGLETMWGQRRPFTSGEMSSHWFGRDQIKEVVCRQLAKYVQRSGNSSKREEELERAVAV